jgi:hypothetical protein
MTDQSTATPSRSTILETFQKDLDLFEQRERQLLADERRERAKMLTERFALTGLGLSIAK